MRRSSVTMIGLILILNMTACKKENEETLINEQGGLALCDTVNMKFSLNILPIIKNNCYSCHGFGQVQLGVNFDTYDNIKAQVDNQKLINVIKHSAGYKAMPLGLPRLSSCNVNKIQAWINKGAPDN